LHQFNCDSVDIMVIVSVTRLDLRDECVMADDVFALSPISARAVQPSEADYDAIRDAFMETSRGRWFLGEYAKRNRNADTSMVLDAVARIEEVLAAQALAAQRQAPAPDDRLFEVLAAVRDAVDRATEAASAAFDSATLEASLAPIRKGIVIIREISWRWREIGADGRICDLIDSQLDAIEAGCAQIATIDPHAALSASFDLIRTTLAQFIEEDAAARPVEDADAAPEPDRVARPNQTQDEAIGADDIAAEPMELEQLAPEAIATGHAQADVDEATFSAQDTIDGDVIAEEVEEDVIEAVIRAPDGPPDMPAEGDAIEAVARADLAAQASEVTAEAAETQSDAQAGARVDAQANAHDEAVLELVAAEMAAPDPIDIDDYSDSLADDIIVTMRPREPIEREPIAHEPIETLPEPAAAPVRPPIVQPFPQAAPAASPPPAPPPVVARGPSAPPPVEPSLGSTIIANGILQPAKPPANDPLAPIRRMSQAEKIAFFS
jgi:hypothetical protein